MKSKEQAADAQLPAVSFGPRLAFRMFGRPRGALGRLGGRIMAHTNRDCGAWVAALLEIGAGHHVLEVGFGPGVVIAEVTRLATAGLVAGIDPSPEMVEQARKRNAKAIESGQVELRCSSVASLPFAEDSFDRALAINSFQVWPDAAIGLREIRRVMKPNARIALGFTPHSGQPREGLTEALAAAGFAEPSLVEKGQDFCALAGKPGGR